MMLTILGLPASFNYLELKMMIKHESSLNDFILDNLVADSDGTKKVRIGVADESEGSQLVKCLDGFRIRGNVLRVVPVAKAPLNPAQSNFSQRTGGYPPRNDLQNQPGNFSNQPPALMGNHPAPWAQNNSQWNPNHGSGPQVPPSNFGYQQGQSQPFPQQQQQPPQQLQRPDGKPFGQRDLANRMPQRDQGFGFQKNAGPDTGRRVEARQLRSVEVMPSRAEPPHAAHQPHAPHASHAPHAPHQAQQGARYMDKSAVINKDYFQGSNQFGPHSAGQQGPGHFQPTGQGQPPPWQPVTQQAKGAGFKPFEEERKYPDKRPPPQKEPDPRDLNNTYKEYDKTRYSPARGAEAAARRPSRPRRPEPGRRPSPGRRGRSPLSPRRRLASPPARRPDAARLPPRSPPRRREKGEGPAKLVRPAYEPEAPNQAMYSGGYRRSSPPGPGRAGPAWEGGAKGGRSPSPRSPRRSWALEKRRSPPHDAPPPPCWPARSPARSPPSPARSPRSPPRSPRAWEPRRRYDDERYDPKRARDPAFEPRDRNFEPRDPKFGRGDREPEPRDRKFEPREPKFESRDPEYDSRDSKFEPRGPKFEPRDSKFESRPIKFELRNPKFEARDPKFEPRDPKFEPREPKFEPREPKFEPREPKFEPREPKFESRKPKFETQEHKFETRDPKFEPRDPKFEPREPKFEPRESKFESRGPKFEPRDPKFQSRDPKFEPRDAKYEPQGSHHRFESRDPKFEPRDSEADRPDRRDFRRPDEPERRGYPEREDFRDFRPEDDRHRDQFRRDDFRRQDRRDDRNLERPESFDKEFDDIYKRAMEFKQKVQELRRTGRSRDRDDEYREDSRAKHEDGRPRRPAALDAASVAKRDKAAEEIARKILDKHATFNMSDDVRARVLKQLKYAVLAAIDDMFGRDDVSFIEMVVKFNAAHGDRDEHRMFHDVMASLPAAQKAGKRPGEESSEIPAKTARRSPENVKPDDQSAGPSNVLRPRYGNASRLRQRVPPPRRPPGKSVQKDVPVSVAKKPRERGEAPVDSLRELDPLTARVLEEELQHVMVKVWQELPDDPASEAERMVVDKFRSEAGEHLKNVLGLNVTKRLLNTFNPLNVKVHFSTKPERKYLRQFLKRYNFVAFKRIARVSNTFAAQVRDIADYDTLARHQDIHCGSAKITVTPYYRYTQCPKNLKTIYGTPDEDKGQEKKVVKENLQKDTDTQNSSSVDASVQSDLKETKVAPALKTEHRDIKTEKTDSKIGTESNPSIKMEAGTAQSSHSVEKPKDTHVKPTTTAPAKTQTAKNPSPAKPIASKTAPVVTQEANKNAPSKPQTVQNPSVSKPQATNNPKAEENKTITNPPPAVPSAQVPSKTVAPKPQIKTEPANPQDEKTTATAKPQAKVEPAKAKVVPAKPSQVKQQARPQPRVMPPKPNSGVAKRPIVKKNTAVLKNKTNVRRMGNKATYTAAKPFHKGVKQKNSRKSFEEDDFEELDDEAILALMSGGIVLDECSGSDEE